MSGEPDIDKMGDELLAGCSTALQTLLSGMIAQGKRRGTLTVRPAISGQEAPYTLRFDVKATLVPDKMRRH